MSQESQAYILPQGAAEAVEHGKVVLDYAKPCPFCAALRITGNKCQQGGSRGFRKFSWYSVSCSGCGASATGDTLAEAFSRWCRRAA